MNKQFWVYSTYFKNVVGPFATKKLAKEYINSCLKNTLKTDSWILLKSLEVTPGVVDRYIDEE